MFAEDVPSLDGIAARSGALGSDRSRPGERPALRLFRRPGRQPDRSARANACDVARSHRAVRSPFMVSTTASRSRRAVQTRRARGACRTMTTREARALGVPALAGGERDRLPLERTWLRPTLEINGIYGGYQGPGAKTIVPSFARAKLSARLVAGQDPAHVKRVVREHLGALAPAGVRVEIDDDGDVRAVATSREHPAVAAAARAMERGFGKAPVFIGTGGTIGPVSSFDRILRLAAGSDRRRPTRRRDPRSEREIRPAPILRRHRNDDVSLRRTCRRPGERRFVV